MTSGDTKRICGLEAVGSSGPTCDGSWAAERPRSWWAETSLVLPRKGALSKLLRRTMMSPRQRTADIAAAPDRTFLKRHVFPHVAATGGDILFVGVRAYTQPYYELLEAEGGRCWTLDVDPAAAEFGRLGQHATASVLDLDEHFDGRDFTTVILGGVLGFGVNRRSDQVAAIMACAARLADGGLLVLSWNDRRLHANVLEDVLLLDLEFTGLSGLPPRLWVLHCDQQFAFLMRKRVGEDFSATQSESKNATLTMGSRCSTAGEFAGEVR